MPTNLLPAILFAGPPHSGKSVLSYQISQRLVARQIEHYLLRAVPDGEGNWFLKSGPAVSGALRARARAAYSPAYLRHMQRTIANRSLPFLVDAGGQPQGGAQHGLLRACTHAVLLYRTPAERHEWRARLDALDLPLVAELRSTLDEAEQIEATAPRLCGVIAGLRREPEQRAHGPLFEALLELLAGICAYDRQHLERLHLAAAPYPAQVVRRIGERLGLPAGSDWLPEHLPAALEQFAPGQPAALYGRGPVWLAAALAARAWPAPFALFDMRYGWVKAPPLRRGLSPELSVERGRCGGVEILELRLPLGMLAYGPLHLEAGGAPAEPGGPLVLSGPLPAWAFAGLGRGLCQAHAWLALRDAGRRGQAVVIHSHIPEIEIGDLHVLPGEPS